MAQIKTVTTTSGENTITFDSFYPYVWIRNSGDNDITAANYSGAQAGNENTVSIKAGEVAMIQAETENIYIIGATTCEIHAQGFAECPFKRGLGGGEQISVESLSVTTNGTYTAPTGTAYSPVVVDVQEQPWTEPLKDGYSNFWFNLTDDALSVWLNIYSKNVDAVIDWGDGSGEQVLDTLRPTHTYSKAGMYIVKIKGVSVLDSLTSNIEPNIYVPRLVHVEFNNEITYLRQNAFKYCSLLQKVDFSTGLTDIANNAFQFNNLRELDIPDEVTTIQSAAFAESGSLYKVTIGSGITRIPAYTFSVSSFQRHLSEIHIKATTPPIVERFSFSAMTNDCIIYVPVGYGDIYKADSNWSLYANRIQEENE